jgi:WD40 repeat protein
MNLAKLTNFSVVLLSFVHCAGVLALDWSDQRHSLYTGDYSQRVKIWDPFVKRSTGVLGSYGSTGHREMLLDVVCNDRLNQIITSDVSGVIKIWDTRTLRCLQTVKDLEQKEGAIGMTAATSDDQGRLITGGATIHRWRTLGAKEERDSRESRKIFAQRIKGRRREESASSITHAARHATSGGKDSVNLDKSTLLLQSLRRQNRPELTQEERKKIADNVQEQQAERKLFCLCPRDRNVFVTLTADGDATVCHFGLHTAPSELQRRFSSSARNHNKKRGIDTTGDGEIDAIGFDMTGDGIIDGFDVTGDGEINFQADGVKHLLRKAHGSLSTIDHRTVKALLNDDILKHATTEITSRFKIMVRHGYIITSAALDHGGRSIFVGGSDGGVRQFNLETGWLIQEFERRKQEVSCLTVLRLHSNQLSLLGCGWDRKLTAWDADGRHVMSHSGGHESDVTCCCQIEEAFMASGDSTGKVCLWSTVGRHALKTTDISQKTAIDPEIAQIMAGGSVSTTCMKQKNSIKGPNMEDLPISVESMCYDSTRRILLVGTSSGVVVALSSTTLGRVDGFGTGVLTTFGHSSVDAMSLESIAGERLMIMDAGRRLRLFALGKKGSDDTTGERCRLVRCWQPRTTSDDTSDARHSLVAMDRGTVTYSHLHRAFATSSKVHGKYCIEMWCAKTGAARHFLQWNGMLSDDILSSPLRNHVLPFASENTQMKQEPMYVSTAPKQPVLSSVGEFALEIDRMKLLENKNVMIYDILHGGVEEQEREEREEREGREEREERENTDDEDDKEEEDERKHHRSRLERKLNKMFLKGLISFHGDIKDRASRVEKRRKKSKERATNMMLTPHAK